MPAVIDNVGAVTRPAADAADATVKLTATIIKNSESDTKTFTLTVKKALSDADSVAADKTALDIGYAQGDSIDSVTRALTLSSAGDSGTTITWNSNMPAVIDNVGAVTRPAADAADATVKLTATIIKNSESDTKTFTLTVKKEDKISVTSLSYSLNSIQTPYNAAMSQIAATTDPAAATGAYSVNPSLPAGLSLNADTGVINGTPTNTVGPASYTVTFTADGIYEGAVTADITIEVSPINLPEGLNFPNESVTAGTAATLSSGSFTGDLANLSPGTDYSLTISPTVTGMTIADNGEISIPDTIATGDAGTYTVKATGKGNYTDTVTDNFELTVSTAPAVNSVTINEGDQTKDPSASAFTLTATVAVVGGADQTVTWSSSDTAVATVDVGTGEVTLKGVAGNTDITATSTVDQNKIDTITLTVSAANSFSYTPATLSAEYGVETASGAPTWTPSTPAGTITYEIEPAVTGVSIAVADASTGRVTIAANKSVTTADETVIVKAMVDGAFYADATITVRVTAAALSGTLTYADKEISEGSGDTLSGSGTLLTGGLTAGTDYDLSVQKAGADVNEVTIDTVSGTITIDNTIATGDAGTYTVKATGKGNYTGEVTTTFTLTVNAVTSVTIDGGNRAKDPSASAFTLTATVEVVGNAAQTVTWSNSADSVATVGANGLVTLQGGVGTTDITAASTVDSSKSDTITLTVATYNIGDIGPGGGVIFWINTDTSMDWKYLEAGPTTSMPPTAGRTWGTAIVTGATSEEIGDGAANTAAIVAAYAAENPPITDSAAHYCDGYANNGFSDWFLPSFNELTKLKDVVDGSVTLADGTVVDTSGNQNVSDYTQPFLDTGPAFWSSTETSETQARMRNMGYDWEEIVLKSRTRNMGILPIRAF